MLPKLHLRPDEAATVPVEGSPRKTICETIHKLIGFYLAFKEDDTNALKTVIKIIKQLVCVRGIPERKYVPQLAAASKVADACVKRVACCALVSMHEYWCMGVDARV